MFVVLPVLFRLACGVHWCYIVLLRGVICVVVADGTVEERFSHFAGVVPWRNRRGAGISTGMCFCMVCGSGCFTHSHWSSSGCLIILMFLIFMFCKRGGIQGCQPVRWGTVAGVVLGTGVLCCACS